MKSILHPNDDNFNETEYVSRLLRAEGTGFCRIFVLPILCSWFRTSLLHVGSISPLKRGKPIHKSDALDSQWMNILWMAKSGYHQLKTVATTSHDFVGVSTIQSVVPFIRNLTMANRCEHPRLPKALLPVPAWHLAVSWSCTIGRPTPMRFWAPRSPERDHPMVQRDFHFSCELQLFTNSCDKFKRS